MPYLVCGNCGEYYKLEEGELSEDYSDICECGGKLEYFEYIPLNKIYKECPRCGFENNPADNTMKGRFVVNYHPLIMWCPKCHYHILKKNTCPICNFEGKLLKQKHNGFGDVCECPSCGNIFGSLASETIKRDKFYYFSLIRMAAYLIVSLVLAILIIRDMFFK